MNAAHDAQLRLLDLQTADTTLAQLAHRRATLPELAALAELDRERSEVQQRLVEARTRRDDMAGQQRKLEGEVDVVRVRAGRDEQRLAAGGLPAKELEGLQHEIATLARRQNALEDDVLEVMEQAETLDAEVAEAQQRAAVVQTRGAELIAARDTALADIDAAAAQRHAQRVAVAAELPADLVALYERARAHGGIGAAMLRHRRCEGCHIELSGTELSALRTAAEDAVVRCENCRCILVRTAESGL